jgi:hypothetical protein
VSIVSVIASSIEVAAILRFFLRVCLAIVLMLTIFRHPKAKNFLSGEISCTEKKDACEVASIFFLET